MAHAHAALFGAPQLEFELGICEAWMEGKDLDYFTGLLQAPLAEISFDFPVCEAATVTGLEDAATEPAKEEPAPTVEYESGDETEAAPEFVQLPPLSKELVTKLQHMSLTDAAAEYGVGTTQFKILCRRLGIKRWPYRKVKSLQRLITEVDAVADSRDVSREAKASLNKWTRQLQTVELQVLDAPLVRLPSFVEDFRSWSIKQRSMQKRKGLMGAPVHVPAPPSCGPETPSKHAKQRA